MFFCQRGECVSDPWCLLCFFFACTPPSLALGMCAVYTTTTATTTCALLFSGPTINQRVRTNLLYHHARSCTCALVCLIRQIRVNITTTDTTTTSPPWHFTYDMGYHDTVIPASPLHPLFDVQVATWYRVRFLTSLIACAFFVIFIFIIHNCIFLFYFLNVSINF